MKKDMPLEGLRWSRDSGSALYDTPPNGRSRTGWGGILAMFFIMCLFWQRKLPPTFIPDAPNAIGTLWKMLTATFACCSIPLFFMRLAEKNIKVITYLGRQTLGIYVVHQTLLALFVKLLESYGLPYWCLVSLLAILTIIVSQIINVLLQKNSVTGFVMLGKR